MLELDGWEGISVEQKDLEFGCIPAGYEWMLRFAKVENIDLTNFQDNCNLRESNNLFTVACVIKKKYPTLNIKIYCNGVEYCGNNFRSTDDARKYKYIHPRIRIKNDFRDGSEKVTCIEDLINRQIPCLISLPTVRIICSQKVINFHIMPVVKIDAQKLTLIDYPNKPVECSRLDVIKYHGKFNGGADIAWLLSLHS